MSKNILRISYNSSAAPQKTSSSGTRSLFHRPRFSVLSLCSGVVAILAVVYIGLIAVVMSYAVLTVEFSQSVRNDEAAVALLESQYFANVSRITNTDYATAGYAKPVAEAFVPTQSVTALR
ncbi:hypothetical protein KGQ25_02410 [Patescibacteria group bacterium]|nr:hypothetical protein [Patescibacteria group bacterium]MDE2021546.1 hypothetical protein [Patescibacteria group bacterium]MDE2173389.1 hypothetical protein [Patescibacteria group bacterium]